MGFTLLICFQPAVGALPYHLHLEEDVCCSVAKLTGVAESDIRMSDIFPVGEGKGGRFLSSNSVIEVLTIAVKV